jgi:hypothetical protein
MMVVVWTFRTQCNEPVKVMSSCVCICRLKIYLLLVLKSEVEEAEEESKSFILMPITDSKCGW